MDKPEIGSIWRHFKGGFYQVLLISRHTETGELTVGYKKLHVGTVDPDWEYCSRPLDMWYDEVEYEGKRVKRFTELALLPFASKSEMRRIYAQVGLAGQAPCDSNP